MKKQINRMDDLHKNKINIIENINKFNKIKKKKTKLSE